MNMYQHLEVQHENQIVLLIIDPQNDFHEGGSLAVPGAVEDAHRIAKLITDNKDKIGEIFVTMDSHHKKHIAHASFWSNKPSDKKGIGESPSPFTLIKSDEINKKWFPRDCTLDDYAKNYATKLEKKGRFSLIIWPDHCLIGTKGHAVYDCIQTAIREWDISHATKYVKHIFKGSNNLTEMYSAIQAEVPVRTDQTTTLNTELLNELRKAGRLLVVGQAKSHCVNFTVRDIVEDWRNNGKNLSDLYILKDAMSNVGGFEPQGDEFEMDMKKEGVTITTTNFAFDDPYRRFSSPTMLSISKSDKFNQII